MEVEDLTSSSVTLTWDTPDSDGGSPVMGYYVERRQAYSTRFSRVNKQPITSNMLKVKDLIEGDEYEFRVVAENLAGCSKPSDTTGTFRAFNPYEKPGKPEQPEVSIKGDNAVLSWMPPRDDGRSKIFNYIIEMKAVGDVRWKQVNIGKEVSGTTYTVPGLQSDVEYEFRISAENKAGISQQSPPSKPVKYGECRGHFVVSLVSYNCLLMWQ